MAASTGLVVTAGALVIIEDLITDKWETKKGLRTAVATLLAAYVGAALDKGLPGLGTGLSVLLVLGVALKSGPVIMEKVLSDKG